MAAKRIARPSLRSMGWLGLAAISILLAPSVANSATVYQYKDGTCTTLLNCSRWAEASFDIVGGNLQVTLTNKSTADTLVPTDVLTAVYFSGIANVAIQSGINFGSAVLAPGSTVFYDAGGQPAGGVVGGEWAYNTFASGATGIDNAGNTITSTQGLSSTGVDLFGPGNRFPGADLQSPDSPNGVEYGLLTAGDLSATGNGGITGSGGLIKNAVIFTMLNTSVTPLTLSSLTSVWFQYGTSLTEPQFRGSLVPGGTVPEVPLPAALPLLLGGLGGLAWLARRQKRNGPTAS